MLFDALGDRFDRIFSKFKGRGRLSESDVEEIAREIRLALLEADVNVSVVRAFVNRIKERATGADVLQSLTPDQQVIKIVHEELVATLGGTTGKLKMSSKPPTVVMMAGLQGSGKTTASAKLARLLKSQGYEVLLVGADLQRPAAVEQLRVLGAQINVPVWSEPSDPVSVARGALNEAARLGKSLVIVDTAGRLQIDAELMEELRQVHEVLQPTNTLLVVDSMTGQEAVNVAESFHAQIELDGVILTKIDGDARGGAALSVKEVIGKPILFAGTGEKLDEFEPFHPDRMAQRILGMGDVLTLIEKAQKTFDEEQAKQAEAKLRKGQFTLDDFLDQLQQIKKMGSLQSLVAMIPGLSKQMRDTPVDEGELRRVEAIIQSMTRDERLNPQIINGSRRLRIAKGSGTTTTDVNRVLGEFKTMQQLMKSMAGRGMAKMAKRGGRGLPGGFGGAPGMPGAPGAGTMSRSGPGGGGGFDPSLFDPGALEGDPFAALGLPGGAGLPRSGPPKGGPPKSGSSKKSGNKKKKKR